MLTLDSMLPHFQIVQGSDVLQPLLGLVLRVLLHALACNQSSATLQNYLSTQRALVVKVGDLDQGPV